MSAQNLPARQERAKLIVTRWLTAGCAEFRADALAQPSSLGTARLYRAKHLSDLLPGGAALRLRGIARYSQYPASLKVHDDYQDPHDAFSLLGAERPYYNRLSLLPNAPL